MEISNVNAANSTATCGAEKPCPRKRDAGGFEMAGLFGCSMRGLIFILQSSITPEQAMNMARFRRRNVIKQEPTGVKVAIRA
jgi:hypothetical protein